MDERYHSDQGTERAGGAFDVLAGEVWAWRTREQPRTDDDIPRVERPKGWLSDWRPGTVARYTAEAQQFEKRWKALPVPDPRSAEATDPAVRALIVDHALIGSVIARALFELTVTRPWQRDPNFYVDQSVGVVFDLLRPEGSFDHARTAHVIAALRHVPDALAQGRTNLAGHVRTELAELSARTLATAGGRDGGAVQALSDAVDALAEHVPDDQRGTLKDVGQAAARALGDYRSWLEGMDGTIPWTPIGREEFIRFLRRIALNPADPEDLLHLGRIELERAEAFSVIESRGHRITSGRSEPRDPLPASTEDICARQHRQEAQLRTFYERRGLLSQPETLRHYYLKPIPDYLEPLQWLGVTDDLAWEKAGERNAVSWQPASSPDLGFFDDAIGRDPMTGLIHEGCHSQQIALSATNSDWIRRHYYDSGANEGIGYYNEEMLERAGLFNAQPGSLETIQAFLRLRTLRVIVDLSLALGRLSIADAAHLLATRVPMDEPTAHWEASFFAKTPGQGMTYQVGKSQILSYLSAAARRPDFTLQTFHDRLWRNGNVPIALQRYETLGDPSALGDIRL